MCFSLADHLLSRGLFSAAQKVIQRLISQSSSTTEAISAADLVFSRGMDLDLVSYASLIRKLVISGEALMAETLYIDRIVGKGLKPDCNLLNSMIICFCKLGKLKEAKHCFDRLIESGIVPWVGSCNAIIKGFTVQDRIFEAYECFCKVSEANDSVLNFACYNRLVDGLSKRGFLDEGLHVFDIMIKKKVPLTVNVCKSLIIGFCKWGRVEEAEILSLEIESHGFVVDKFMYTYLINSYCKARKMKMAMRLYMRMMKMGYEPDNYTYNTLIHGFINLGLFSEGWVLHNEMVSSGLKPSLVTYQVMLHKYCRDGKVDCALKLLSDIIECNIAPNVHCYTVLLAALCKEQKLGDVYKLYHKMLDNGVVPDHVLFFTLVKNHPEVDELYFALTVLQAIAKEPRNIEFPSRPKSNTDVMVEIERVLDEIVKNRPVIADKAFSIYIIALCMGGKIDAALDCMEKMEKLRLVPLHTAFNSLIKLLSQEGLVDSAESLLKVMQDPNQLTFEIIVNELCKKGDFSSAVDVLYRIEEKGIKPSVSIYNSIIGCLGRNRMIHEAESFFYRMLEFGVDPDVTVFVTMINAYSKNGQANKAQKLFEKMTDCDLRPNSPAYTALIPGLVKKNMTKKSCVYLGRMLKDGFLPNVVLYTALIKQFLRKREFEFAFRLFGLMSKSEVEQDLVTCITFLSGVSRNIRGYNGNWYLSNKKSENGKEIMLRLLHQTAISSDGKSLRILIASQGEMKFFALKLIERIKKMLPVLDLYLYNGIISGLCWAHGMREAYEHLDEMLRDGLCPNQVTFTILIDGHIQFGEIDNAVALFNRMNANGVLPDRMLFNTLIRGFCRAGRFVDALSVSHTMQKRGFLPSKSSYEKILGLLCGRRLSGDALRIFEEMVAHGYFPCRYNVRWLSSILWEDDKLEEARGVCEMLMSRRNDRKKLESS
ncbi:pentatricopeptide repeat-containing protein at5g62370 [Phtheirospermum japonicum]|uniref:Pentatricopeptide repeat-containing protein at5g62370 n=1 Tax=Phtheirospermum japonicum TaxID=374723 RepID=A0A830BN30_9LAMI|nr:pentatricopeptide repeat-containing protein at5g62370 [Phtheirospermum japonicum]